MTLTPKELALLLDAMERIANAVIDERENRDDPEAASYYSMSAVKDRLMEELVPTLCKSYDT